MQKISVDNWRTLKVKQVKIVALLGINIPIASKDVHSSSIDKISRVGHLVQKKKLRNIGKVSGGAEQNRLVAAELLKTGHGTAASESKCYSTTSFLESLNSSRKVLKTQRGR